jgi:hypothetical protein
VKPLEYAKAIAGAVVAGLGSLYLALDNDVVTTQEWVGIASLTLATFIGVWGVPNAAPAPKVADVEAPKHLDGL